MLTVEGETVQKPAGFLLDIGMRGFSLNAKDSLAGLFYLTVAE